MHYLKFQIKKIRFNSLKIISNSNVILPECHAACHISKHIYKLFVEVSLKCRRRDNFVFDNSKMILNEFFYFRKRHPVLPMQFIFPAGLF